MSCVQCPSDPLPPCNCNANQQCIRINQSCDQCARNVCQDLDGSSGGGSNVGATAGGAVGGAAAGIVLVTLLWFFFRRRRGGVALQGLVGSTWGRLKHSRSHSRNLGAHERGEELDTISRPVSKALDNRASRLSKRVSIHADDDEDAEELENPFADPQRASLSRLTPLTSAAYQPPDANSMSLEDGHQRTVLGEKRNTVTLSTIQEAIEPIKPKTPAKSKAKSKPKPLRPSRDPALDLVLPAASPSSQIPATPDSMSSQATLNAPMPKSHFSGSSWETGYSGLRSSNALSVGAGDVRSSAVSGTSSRGSYLTDPPTLVKLSSNAERVEIARANPVVLTANSRQVDRDPFADPASDDALQDAMDQIADLDAARPNDELQDAIQQIANLDAARPNDEIEEAMHQIAELQAARPDSVMSVPESNRSTLFPTDSSSVRAPSTASFSGLDGIPFMAGQQNSGRISTAETEHRFPQQTRASTADASRPASAASLATTAAAWIRGPQSTFLDPAVFPLPNQGRTISMASLQPRPSSGLTDMGDVTRRSGFSSGGALANVPFQLAFPGERSSMGSEARMSSFSELPEMFTARSSLANGATMDPFADSEATIKLGDEQSAAPLQDVDLDDGHRHSAVPSTVGRASISSLASLAAHFVGN